MTDAQSFTSAVEEKWNAGDWHFFSTLPSPLAAQAPLKTRLDLILAGAALQQKNANAAKNLLGMARQLLPDPHLLNDFMLAVCQVQLGRAVFAAGRPEQALAYFQQAWATGGSLLTPLFYPFLCEAAEWQLAQGNTRAAIQTWQDIAAIMQEYTPEHVYHRMSHGYAVNTQGFGGSKEENHLFGDCHKHDVLEYFHQRLKPEFYFEIGVDEGLSLARAHGRALGVDARPELNLKVSLPEQAQILGMSSDAFFRDKAAQAFATPPELAFIDGMHLFEFALRDFMNFERYASPYTLVVIDDIYPCHPVQAERRRQSGAWTGDVWKLLPVLQRYRSDLTLVPLRSFTTGLLLITGLDAGNTVLQQHYHEIVREYQPGLPVPESILQRHHSLPSNHGYVDLLLNCLKAAREQSADLATVRQQLALIQPLLLQTMEQSDSITSPLHRYLTNEHNTAPITAQLFLPQPQAPCYTEKASLCQAVNKEGWQTLDFRFTQALPEQPLRFDPADRPVVLELSEVILINETNNEVCFSATNPDELNQLRVGGDAFVLNTAERFLINACSSDPIIFLPALAPMPAASWLLQVRLRQISNNEDLRAIWQQHLV